MKAIHRCMAAVAGAAVVWSGLLAAPGQARESGTKGKLLYQTLNMFQHHCLKCHGDAAPRGGVRIFDRTLLVKQRQVIHPGSPETSELFDLVQGGSMPPGNSPKVPQQEIEYLREWIRAGADLLPDESYVLWSIVCDLRTRTDEQKRSIRYLSLNHLLGRENTSRALAEQRQTLERVLRHLVSEGSPPPDLRPIEPTGTVFRIDLRQLGWDRHPYPQAEMRWGRLNLFDLILLEYPYGRLPTDSPFYHGELLRFLRALQGAGQVRPVPYVRADWLAEVMAPSQSPLYRDFLKVLGRLDNKRVRNGDAERDPLGTVEFAAHGLDRGGLTARLWEREGPRLALPPLRLRGGEEIERPVFREYFAEQLLGQALSGIPILPVDGLTHHPRPNPDVEFKAIDFRQRNLADPPAKDPFIPGDRMSLWIKTKWSAVAEVIQTDKHGQKWKRRFRPLRGRNEPGPAQEVGELEAGEALILSGKDNKGMEMELNANEEQDIEEWTIYAYRLDDLKKISDFPKGVLLQAKGLHDRVVHPLYELQPNGQVKPPDPSQMVKVTLPVTTRRPKARQD
jgi:hypothetical protein